MYSLLCAVISLIISFIVVLILAKTRVLDFIGELTGCGTMILFRLGIVVAIFLAIFFITNNKINPSDYVDTYLTTLDNFLIYEKVIKEPHGKDIGTLPKDSVFKAIQKKNKKSITFLEGYVLSEGNPKHIYILIPDQIKTVKENCKYFTYSEKSRSFSAYYEKIDKENEITKNKIRKEFKNEIENNNIKIEYSNDNILKESIKKTHFILPESGYFGLYSSKTSDFYYVKIEDKKKLNKIVSLYRDKHSDELKSYFNK